MAKRKNASPDTAAKTPLKVEFFPDKAVRKELENVPPYEGARFALSLNMLSNHLTPVSTVKPLTSLGHGVYELIENGSPAWRCIYTTELAGKIVVLHATDKTTNGRDRQIANVVEQRLKAMRQAYKAEKQAKQKQKKAKKK